MKLKYSDNIEDAIYIIKSILSRNIELEHDGSYLNIPVYYDQKDREVVDKLYSFNRSDGLIEIQSILPACSVTLTEISPISEFKLQKSHRIKIENEVQFTPILFNVLFEATYYTNSKSDLINITQQLHCLFDPEYVFYVTYPFGKVETAMVMENSAIELSDETDENGENIYSTLLEFKIKPIIQQKITKPQDNIEIKSTINNTQIT